MVSSRKGLDLDLHHPILCLPVRPLAQSKVRTAAGRWPSMFSSEWTAMLLITLQAFLLCFQRQRRWSRLYQSSHRFQHKGFWGFLLRRRRVIVLTKQTVRDSLTTKNGHCLQLVTFYESLWSEWCFTFSASLVLLFEWEMALIRVLHWWTCSLWLCMFTMAFALRTEQVLPISQTFTVSNNVTGAKQHVGLKGPGIIGSPHPDPIQSFWYILVMCTGALGQTSVIYAIVKTFTPMCSTVYHVLSDNERLQCTLSIPSPSSTFLVQ